MTFRKQILAGLIAALAVPAIAQAASSGPTWYDIQNNPVLRQRYAGATKDQASSDTTAKDFDLKHDTAMRQGADHNAANAAAAPMDSSAPGAKASREWSLRHWKAMQQGSDHQTASIQASKQP